MFVKESQALDLLELTRGQSDVDKKINEFVAIKALVKHQAVQFEAIDPLFEACRIAISSPNTGLSSQALSCLGHLTKRVSIQDPSRIRSNAHHTVPFLVEKLGDQKERNKTVALMAIVEMYKHAPQEVEKNMKELAFSSKNVRIRQEAIKWLGTVYATNPAFSFKPYTPYLIKLLEDPSEPIREAAKNAVVELFGNAPEHAKSDLKRELAKRGVRKAIANYIVSQLGIPGGGAADALSQDGEEEEEEEEALSGAQANAGGSLASSAFISSLPGSELEDMPPMYVNTNRELEDIFDSMVGPFEGRESEHNWVARESNVQKIRRMLRGNAYKDFQVTFVTKIKSLLDGILKTANSLRTTLSSTGGQLIKDLAIIAGPGIDNMVEILLMNFVKQCANTKKITSQLGSLVVCTMLANVSYHPKLLQHIWNACQDKNVQPRSYAAGWIMVVLETHIDHKAYIEHTGGVEVISKCVKRGLADANPGVRENMRKTYWKFGSIWPDAASAILEGLDSSSRKLLEKTNPNAGAPARGGASSFRAPALSRAATAPARPSVRDAILAQKKSKGKLRAEAERALSPPLPSGPTGLASAPVRRPQMKPRVADRPHLDPVHPARAASPTLGGSSRLSPPLSPPLARMARGVTPGRAPSPLVAGPRKLTVLEQLNSTDWRVRVEGIIVVACILAKRTPPNYDGQKMPTLPPSDVFAPTLAKLFNDPRPEVVENLVAPEVLAELAKVVPMEQIIPKVILLNEGDDELHAQPINAATMPALKQMMSDEEAADLLLKVIQSMNSSGVHTRKLSPVSFTPTQKRKITHGCLIWMNELIERYGNGMPNEFFNERANYKQILNRFIQMMSTFKSQNLMALAALLKNFQRLDGDLFEKTLSTFEPSIAKELRRAWGINVEDDADSIIMEEKVADVEQVLGSVPEVGGMAHRARMVDYPPAPRPVTPLAQSAQDGADLVDLPALPASPEGVTGPAVSSRKAGWQDENPSIKVYQDPVSESNEAAQAATVSQRGAISAGKEWQSYKVGKLAGANTNFPKVSGESAKLLQALIGRLQARDMDTQAFRKLIGVARENPVREPLQEANGESGQDIWQGGAVFRDLLVSLLDYLKAEDIVSPRAGDLRVQGLLVLKQLLSKASPYFVRHEAEVLSTLILLRGRYPLQAQITTAIEEISDDYMVIADPKAGIDAILDINHQDAPMQSWCMSLSCLAALVKVSSPASLEGQYERLGEFAVKSLEDEDSEVRRNCVTMCIEMHSKLRDDERLFDEILKGMKSGHQNLLAYYFARKDGEERQ